MREIFHEVARAEPLGLEPTGLICWVFAQAARRRGVYLSYGDITRWVAVNGFPRKHYRNPRGHWFTGIALRDDFNTEEN
ncbi:hypothetical protein [Streptomyces tirandamycinicus]|nr:hypothetical protein [Streptomyces tirandamycinicus]